MSRILLPLAALLIATGLGCDGLAPNTDGGFGSLDGEGNGSGNQNNNSHTGLDSDSDAGSVGPVTPGGNNPPHADAGADKSGVPTNSQVYLEGSGTDLDGDPLTYQWDLTTSPPGAIGAGATIQNDTFAQAMLVVTVKGTYVARLTVSDGKATDTDTVRIDVIDNNQPPKAAFTLYPAGTIYLGSGSVTADASSSSDPDGDPLSYNWTLNGPPGSSSYLAGASNPTAAVNVSFIPTTSGLYTVGLKVSDGLLENQASPRSVTVMEQPSSGSGSSSGGGSDCLDCAEPSRVAAVHAWSAGDLASSVGLLGLPILLVLWHRRREDD